MCPLGLYTRGAGTNPANAQRNKHVITTSKRRFDIIITWLLHCEFAEKGGLVEVSDGEVVILTTQTLSAVEISRLDQSKNKHRDKKGRWSVTHTIYFRYSLGELNAILDKRLSSKFSWLIMIAEVSSVILSSNECHGSDMTLLMIHKYWLDNGLVLLGNKSQPNLYRHMALPGHMS